MATILVIGGDAATRLAARRTLEHAGFAVAAADDHDPAEPPDLIVADIDALDAEAMARQRRRHPAARLLAISCNGRHGERCGAGRLAKPFTPSQLLAALRLCLARPAAAANSNEPAATRG